LAASGPIGVVPDLITRAEALAADAFAAVCKWLQAQLAPLLIPAFLETAAEAEVRSGGRAAAVDLPETLRPVADVVAPAVRLLGLHGISAPVARAVLRQWCHFMDAIVFNALLTRSAAVTAAQAASLTRATAAWAAWLAATVQAALSPYAVERHGIARRVGRDINVASPRPPHMRSLPRSVLSTSSSLSPVGLHRSAAAANLLAAVMQAGALPPDAGDRSAPLHTSQVAAVLDLLAPTQRVPPNQSNALLKALEQAGRGVSPVGKPAGVAPSAFMDALTITAPKVVAAGPTEDVVIFARAVPPWLRLRVVT